MVNLHVYLAETESLNDDAVFRAHFDTLSPTRRAKVERMRFQSGKNLSVGVGALIDIGLRAYGLRERGMIYGKGENGKPFFAAYKGPVTRDAATSADFFAQNPSLIRFNASHSKSCAMACFAESYKGVESADQTHISIGCDIECIKSIDLGIARRYFNQNEYTRIMSEPTEEARRILFFRLWSLKESFMKTTGLGLQLPLSEFEIYFEDSTNTPNTAPEILLPSDNTPQVHQHVDSGTYHFAELSVQSGYACSVCANDKIRSITCTRVRLEDTPKPEHRV